MQINCRFADGAEQISVPLTVAPALRPWGNLQINAWNEDSPAFDNSGFTIVKTELEAHRIDAAARRNFYGNFNFNSFGTPRPGVRGDRAVDSNGNLTWPNPRSAYIRNSVAADAAAALKKIANAPTFKALVINSEQHAGSAGNNGSFDFSPEELARAAQFGLDLQLWRLTNSPNDIVRKMLPLGGLSPQQNPELIPPSGAVSPTNPLYAYLRERHSASGGTDVVLNDIIAAKLLQGRPDMLIMQDPVLRRPPLRSYRRINVAQDWVYYPESVSVVTALESLAAMTRGNKDMSSSVMPQFLLKHGMAAPYSGMPTGDMFRISCYLASGRPQRVISFWNAHNAFVKGKGLTADEIKKLLGNGDYKSVMQTMRTKKLDPFCFVPELLPEFKKLSATLWEPLGALLPNWRNAPRRMAVINSFAGHIFGAVRWPGYSRLLLAAAESGIPYDELLDDDWDNDLPDYDVIVLPDGFALPEKAVAKLRDFMARGGKLVVDDSCRVTSLLPGAVKFNAAVVSRDAAEAAKRAAAALQAAGGRTESPLFIEAMQQFQAEGATGGGGAFRRLTGKYLRGGIATANDNLYWNELTAAGAKYLHVVNDLRIPGPVYGRFGKVRETGVAQQAAFKIAPDYGVKLAYDLLSGDEFAVADGKLQFCIGGAECRIFLLTSQILGKMTLRSEAAVKAGAKVAWRINIPGAPGLLPVKIELIMPSGKTLRSENCVLTNGALQGVWVVPRNALPGVWTLRATALNGRREAECPIRVIARR